MAHSQNPRAGKIQAHSPANCWPKQMKKDKLQFPRVKPKASKRMPSQNNGFHLDIQWTSSAGTSKQIYTWSKKAKGQDKVHRRSKCFNQSARALTKKQLPHRDKQDNTRSSPEPIQELQVVQSRETEPKGFTQRARPKSPQEVKQTST
jgi:hypothetical protein